MAKFYKEILGFINQPAVNYPFYENRDLYWEKLR